MGDYTLDAGGAAPVPPTTVRTEPGNGEIDVHFDRPGYAETDVSEYTIYRTEAGGTRQKIATVGADKTVYTDASANDNTTACAMVQSM
jgi:hypothetical protein